MVAQKSTVSKVKSSSEKVMDPTAESKGKKGGKKESLSGRVMLLPVSAGQTGLYNVKELGKQYNKMIEEAAKAIVALNEKTEESVSEALQSTFDSVYSYALESQLSNGKKNKKSKRVKDPNAPKKALSNYMVYCMRHRSDVQGKHPNAKPTEISRILGAQWNALTPEQKSKFIDTTASA